MPMRLSDINFERFSDVEIHDVFDGLVDFGITPLIALADVVEEETHAAFANSVINEIQAKLEDLQATIERLSEQWEQGRLKPSRIKEFGEETEAKLESLLKGIEPKRDKETKSEEAEPEGEKNPIEAIKKHVGYAGGMVHQCRERMFALQELLGAMTNNDNSGLYGGLSLICSDVLEELNVALDNLSSSEDELELCKPDIEKIQQQAQDHKALDKEMEIIKTRREETDRILDAEMERLEKDEAPETPASENSGASE